jgi:hypothetical protein
MTTFERQFRESTTTFNALVAPKLKSWFGALKVISIEERSQDKLCQYLDMFAGIDAYLIRKISAGPDIGRYDVMQAIASRIQPVRKPYDTFTVRVWRRKSGWGTELVKRLLALDRVEGGASHPHLTCQAYVNPERSRLLSLGVVETRPLIYMVKSSIEWLSATNPDWSGDWHRLKSGDLRRIDTPQCTFRLNPQDGTIFSSVRWDSLTTRVWRPIPARLTVSPTHLD